MIRFQFKQYIAIFCGLTASLLMASCKQDSASTDCTKPFTATVVLAIDSKSEHLTFPSDQLNFLSDPNLVLQDVDLNLKVKGKRSKSKDSDDIQFSLNGIKTTRRDGEKHCDTVGADLDGINSRTHSKLQKFFLNGADSFEDYLKAVKKNKGTLKIDIHGDNVTILEASVTFTGKTIIPCTTTGSPTPTPTATAIPVVVKTVIDSTAPAQSPTSANSITINFSSQNQGVSSFCSMDNSTYSSCSSPKSYSNLANGTHSFRVYSQDAFGNKDAVAAMYTWVIDSIKPSVSISNISTLPTLTNQTGISFSLSSSEAASFVCSLDGNPADTCVSPAVYSGLSEGSHLFSVTAVDAVGNVSANPASFQWSVDLTAPTASIISVVPAGIISNSTTKSFSFMADESATFECSSDHGAFAACTSPFNRSGITEGNHSIDIRAKDTAGNVGLPVSYSWKVDTTAPVLSLGLISPFQGITNAKNISVEFNSTEPVNASCSFDGAAAAPCVSPFTQANVVAGNHTLIISSLDFAGNASANLSLAWKMDFTAPIISFGNISPTLSSHVNFNSVSYEVNGATGSTLVATLNGVTLSETSSPLTLSNLAEGSYNLVVKAVSSAGNTSNIITSSFIVDMTAPTVSLAVSNLINPTQLDSNTMTFSASESARFECQLDNAGFGPCTSPLAISGLADGNRLFEVRAIDLAGNISASQQYSWVIDTIAPVTIVSGSQTSVSSVIVNFSANESVVTYDCKLDDGLKSACVSPLMISNLPVGLHLIVVSATDAAGNRDASSATYTFEVLPAIQTQLISVTPANSPTNISTEVFEFNSTHDVATFVCSVDGSALAPCSSPFSYLSPGDGTHTFNAFAIDQYGAQDPVGITYTWILDTTSPIATSVSFVASVNSITVNWVTSEPTTTKVLYGAGFNVNLATVESTSLSTTHSVTLVGLTANSNYSVTLTGHDQAGNTYASGPRTTKTTR